MAQTLEAIMQSLNGQYDPRKQLVNQQMTDLPGQETAALAGLDQAKTNSFNDISNAANARGMAYSGAPVDEQQKYLGATYLPQVAQVKQNTQQQRYKLQDALMGLNTEQATTAASLRETQLNRDLQDSQFKQQQAASERQMQMQAQLQREAQQAQMAAQQAQKVQLAHDPSGGWQIKLPDGTAGTLAQYANGNIATVLQYLAQGSAGDKKLAASVSKMNLQDAHVQQKLQQQYPHIFGGV